MSLTGGIRGRGIFRQSMHYKNISSVWSARIAFHSKDSAVSRSEQNISLSRDEIIRTDVALTTQKSVVSTPAFLLLML